MSGTETHRFQAETSEVLHLVVHSLYTTKDIFLRELISNASDALDRLRFEALRTAGLVPDGHAYEIRLETDRARRRLTVHDTGIGMSRQEVMDNIGTIARSGTREVLREAAAAGNGDALSRLIGQFGVGFYSAFMVADRVELVTRRPGEATATRWESTGDGEYTLSDTVRDRCGTSITLHLKPVDEEAGILDFADPFVLQRIVKRYSDFITHPIIAKMERTEYERNEDGTLKEGAEPRTVVEDRTLNAMKPIWTRPASEVSEEEHAEFYHHVSHDWGKPLKTLQMRAEGRTEYSALLYIPERPPLDMFGGAALEFGLQLYAKQVMIMERCAELLEPWLRFVRGVVDAADLPLNVSREMLQQDRHLVQIRTWIAGRVLKALDEMRSRAPEDYRTFWRAFGRVLKEAYLAGEEHRARLDELVLFGSSADPVALVSLADYVARMPEGQPAVFYLTGPSRSALESSPHLEAVRAAGFEVLYLTDPVDELVVERLTEYGGKPLRSAARGDLELGGGAEREATKEEREARKKELEPLLTRISELLADHVREVRLSTRLTDSPSCLVAGEHDLSPQLARLLRESGHGMPAAKRILELNPRHPLVARLRERVAEAPDEAAVADGAHLLLGFALLAEGSEVHDPKRFNALLAELMARAT